MKSFRSLLVLLLVAMLCVSTFVACDKPELPTEAPTSAPTEAPTTAPTEKPTDEPTEAPTTTPTETPTEKPTEPSEDYPTITIAEALQLCGDEPSDAPTTERYYIRATITEMKNASYGEMTITDETGSICVYGTYSADGVLKFNQLEEKPQVGDEILIYATLQNYKGKKEVQNARLIEFTKGEGPVEPPVQKPEDGAEITIAQAIEIANAQGETATTERYIIKGTIVSIDKAQYGAMTITDGKDTIVVYGTYSKDGSIGYADMTDKPYKGDSVVLSCTLHSFNGTPEVKNARLISFEKNEIVYDESQYTEMSIAQVRDAAKGTKIKVDGVVARITYANGKVPSGFILVDETGSIYVYDKDAAGRVQIGNKISIAGEKTYWILETEQTSADKFGYIGCNQMDSVIFLSNDEKTTNEFDKSWIETTTVKDIIDTPVSVDITSKIFKVNALISKVPGNGFVNYYLNDIDGVTGAYTYTQCNGGDFSWLDQFDGKICTVYLVALNAKSTSTECFWRFLPVAVVDENFKFNIDNAAEFAVKYYGLGQFMPEYTGDPQTELITSVSSELLGFEGVSLTYSSSDESVVRFTESDGKIVLNCGMTGTATVTITASYGESSYSQTVEISVEANQEYDTITVAEAIDAELGEIVTIRGIVGPSLVNRDGFYLFDETGMVSVVVNSTSVFSEIEIGHEIVITGKRDCFKDPDASHAGQIAISKCEVVANYYGDHDYPTDRFITDKTLADFYALKVNEDHSTEVYVLKATVSVVETQYYTNIKLTSGNTTVSLYCSSASQYNFLKAFANQEVTLELAPCNWNNKTFYAGCVLAVHTTDGKVVNELNFNN